MRTGPIITIEDDEDDQFLIRRAVQELAIPNELRFFSNGVEALHYLEVTAEKPFIILCDMNMPLMSGLELRERIEANDYLKNKAIPFIFLTTDASPDLVSKAYQATIQGFFRKATKYEALKEQLRSITDYWNNCLHPNSS